MKAKRLWLIPCAFFLVACAVNLYGCLLHNVTVERYVKGALLAPMVFYGAALLVITFCGLCGLVRIALVKK